MVTVQVKRTVRLPVSKSSLQRVAQMTLDSVDPDNKADLSIVIGDDSLLHKLNKKYLNVNAPTDVLSFPSGEVDPDTQSYYLGDIVISLPRADEQASTAGHALADELQLLVVHGTLHLLGYDHLKIADKKAMQAAQDKILSKLDIDVTSTL